MSKSPILLIGTHRSGTTWFAQQLSQHPTLAYWSEPRYVWSWGNSYKPDDVLTEADAHPNITRHIRDRFARYVSDQGKQRLFEKTPSNCLRISFIRKVFPDAKIIHIIRDGRSVFRSADQLMTTGYYRQDVLKRRTFEMLQETQIWEWPAHLPRIVETLGRKITRQPLKFWGPKPPGWREWIKTDTQNIILAKQWAAAVSFAVRDSASLKPDQYLRFRYEDLMTYPTQTLRQIFEFAELSNDSDLVSQIAQTVDSSRQSKWRHALDGSLLEEIEPHIKSVLTSLGYEW